MSPTETTATYEPRHYRHRRTEVDAIFYDGTEHARDAIVAWVLAGGGQVESRSTGDLLVLGARGWMPVRPGLDHVVRSIDVPGRGREFFPMGDDVLSEAYNGNDCGAALDRDQAAALVVAADEIAGSVIQFDADEVDIRTVSGAVHRLREIVHTLGTSHEALR